ncbi:hypothetical protein GCM10007067_15350 [Lysobacter bugurensis]|uniref:CAAX prenyl protease 2/Lysostaphin resistance protein A-like domain-containing protein n=2 Tax=Cognatilysobacter bugurensis TaxID=543356 RepID=A0A918SYC4_9GAMM|nr:hypothetical protein GCM10007067_15350 [Lysobacter bugurensis]
MVLLGLWCCTAALWVASPLFPLHALRELQGATGGWLSVTLTTAVGLGVVQLAIVFGPGRQTPLDVGWRPRAIVPALISTVALWALMHAGTLAWSLANGTALTPAPAWAAGAGVALGPVLAQLLGVALVEETVFRGYLWPQVVLRLRSVASARIAWVLGLLLSQAWFAALHVPVLLSRGLDGSALASTLLMLLFVGLVFACVYAATGNLWLAVGGHALGNTPTLLVTPQGPHPTMWLLAGLLAIVAVAWTRRVRAAMRSGQSAWMPDAARGAA